MAPLAAPLDSLIGALDQLRQSLDRRDAAAIVTATRDVASAIEAVRAQQATEVDPEIRAKLEELTPMIENARLRVNIAADDVRKRISRLAQKGVDMAVGTYGR